MQLLSGQSWKNIRFGTFVKLRDGWSRVLESFSNISSLWSWSLFGSHLGSLSSLWALSYICSITRSITRIMLALVVYFLTFAMKLRVSPFLKSMTTCESADAAGISHRGIGDWIVALLPLWNQLAPLQWSACSWSLFKGEWRPYMSPYLVSRILEIFLQFCLHFSEKFSSGL